MLERQMTASTVLLYRRAKNALYVILGAKMVTENLAAL